MGRIGKKKERKGSLTNGRAECKDKRLSVTVFDRKSKEDRGQVGLTGPP